MLSLRGQAGLEAKFLASVSASASKTCPRPRPRPRAFGLGLSSNFLFWPRENAFLVFAKTAGGVGKISTTNQPGSEQGLRCCSWATYQEDANRTVQPLSDCSSITESVGNLSQYRITATPQISDCHQQWSIRSSSWIFSPGQTCTRPLFSRMFCVRASSAPVERIFSQSGIIMSARRAHMSNAVLETLVFLKYNCRL